MNNLNVLCYVGFAASVIALPFLLVNWARYIKARRTNRLISAQPEFPVKSVSFFVIAVLMTGLLASSLTAYARRDTLNFLQTLSGNYRVYVNQQQVGEPDKMISALKQIAPYWAHHSHPTKRIRVDIHSESRNLTLELGRDSANPQEYWVFSSDHGVTSQNEIGRITTPEFDAY